MASSGEACFSKLIGLIHLKGVMIRDTPLICVTGILVLSQVVITSKSIKI